MLSEKPTYDRRWALRFLWAFLLLAAIELVRMYFFPEISGTYTPIAFGAVLMTGELLVQGIGRLRKMRRAE
ncbi:MAG: hypothetical protein RBT76_09940 [candidate division Zixibacteria bacterium]|jgi:hypothetical protein|nr:hypothetical protein [candidate division Zixibacteria bacterium]